MLKDIPNRANLLLQILLWFNVRILVIFAFFYACHILYYVSNYVNLKGALIVVAFLVTLIVEVLRLYYGYSGNLKGKPAHLSIFLIISPLVQLPIFTLLLFLNNNNNNNNSTTTWAANYLFIFCLLPIYSMLSCMCIQFFAAIYTFHQLCQVQSQLYKIKLDMTLQQEMKKQRETLNGN